MKNTFLFFLIFVFTGCHNEPAENIVQENVADFVQVKYPLPSNKDSLLALLQIVPEDTNKLNILIELAWEKNRSDPDTSFLLNKQALQLSQKLSKSPNKIIAMTAKRGNAISYNHLGTFNYFKSDFISALENYNIALKLWMEQHDKVGEGKTLGNIANVYQVQGDYNKALDYDFRVLQIADQLGNKELQGNTLGNIGVIYTSQEDYTKALEYCFRGLNIAEGLGIQSGIATKNTNIGNVYSRMGKLSKANEYYRKSLEIYQSIGNKYGEASALGNIGIIIKRQGDSALAIGNKNFAFEYSYPEAMKYYSQALTMAEEIGNKEVQMNTLGSIGSLFMSENNYKEAEIYLLKTIALSRELKTLNKTRQFEEILSNLYFKYGDFKSALEHFRKYSEVKDSLFTEEKNNEVMRKEMKYEFEKREISLKAEQERTNTLAFEEKKKQQWIIFVVSGGLLLVLLLAGVIFRSLQLNKKKNIVISKQKEIVEEKQKEILDSIHYAKRIQQSLLPTEKYIEKQLKRKNVS